MENYAYTSYAESGESSPRSRDVDFENPQPWEDQSAAGSNGSNYKVKFMCSYGGKILPRPHDNQLSYVGGETKIMTTDRLVKFGTVMAKLTALCDGEVCVKYQLPGEDLDALISVTNDDDLEHMMHEYDRLNKASPSPARLRLFLFPVSGQSPALTPVHSFSSVEERSDRERFVDALNSRHLQPNTPPSAQQPNGNLELMFGADKGMPPPPPPQPSVVMARARDHHTVDPQIHQQEQEIEADQIQKHIQDLQRLQIANEQQQQPQPGLYRKPSDDNLAAAGYTGDYYLPKITEKLAPTQQPGTVQSPPTQYQISGGFQASTISQDQQQQPVYMIQTPSGMYHAPPPVNHQQGYYVHRMPTDVYRDQPVYNVMPQVQQVAAQQTTVSTQAAQQQFLPQKVATYTEGYRMVQSTTAGTEHGYTQVAYENGTGRQIYYTNQGAVLAQPQQGQQAQQSMQPTAQQYQTMVAALNQDGGGKVAPVNMKEFM